MFNAFFMVTRCDAAAYSEDDDDMLSLAAAPRYVHLTRDSAEREAERLSARHPDREYAILECINVVRAERYDISGLQWLVPVYQAPRQ